MLALVQFLNAVNPLSPETQQLLSTMLKQQLILKGRYWLREGQVCDKIAFIENGLVRIFFESGSREVCLWYVRENDVMLSAKSFFSRSPSLFSMQAIEDTTVYYISYAQLHEVYEKHPSFNINGRRILEHYYSLSEMHVKLLLEPTAKRIKMLMELYPWMLQDARITDKMLAAYMGVSHEYWCRFKGRKR